MPVQQLNVEYLFRLVYDCLRGARYAGGSFSSLAALAAELWVWISLLGYLLAALALAVIIYCLIRIRELREREEHVYGPLHIAKEEGPISPRWAHIEDLMKTGGLSDWRQAIIEADIMLGDLLAAQGYRGTTIGDQLKQVEPADFDSLHDAWQAHDVRNQVAHAGSAYDLSETLAKRTIGRYERVFREFEAI